MIKSEVMTPNNETTTTTTASAAGTVASSEPLDPNNQDINNCSSNNSTMNNTTINDSTNGTMTPKKPRRSIKVEGNCLSNMLREGYAKVTDASRLGKRLSSEIWNSFGAIQVPDDFTNPSIETKTVADGPSTVKICHYFVACGKCFSVFKYDGHAYGTTGLVKHLKNCQGTNNQRLLSGQLNNSNSNNNNNSFMPNISTSSSGLGQAEHNNASSMSTNTSNNSFNDNNRTAITNRGITKTTPKRKRGSEQALARGGRNSAPSIRHLVRAIEELRNEQIELKQKIQEMLTMMGPGYMGQIQIINEGDKSDEP